MMRKLSRAGIHCGLNVTVHSVRLVAACYVSHCSRPLKPLYNRMEIVVLISARFPLQVFRNQFMRNYLYTLFCIGLAHGNVNVVVFYVAYVTEYRIHAHVGHFYNVVAALTCVSLYVGVREF